MIRTIIGFSIRVVAAGLLLWASWLLLCFAAGNPTWHGVSSVVLSLLSLIGAAVAGIGGFIRFVSEL